VIRGELFFQSGAADLSGATASVRLLDVSRADAASRVLAETRVAVPHGATTDHPLAFALDAVDLDPQRSYTLAAHVDCDGDGAIGPGDYITMEHVPVEAGSMSGLVRVPLRRVGG
jgi:uncharacterized lipoprotein YbaY